MLEPHRMDSLGHHHHAKKLSPKIALHFKVLCESKATLPIGFLKEEFRITPQSTLEDDVCQTWTGTGQMQLLAPAAIQSDISFSPSLNPLLPK